jgi:predicted AlkP superfamily phosphohydrolase/phosphomutase
VIGDQGGRVLVLNVPLTHPPYPVNGALISDFLLATGRGGTSFPPELLGEIESRFGTYHSDAVLPYFVVSQAEEDVARFIREYTQAVEYKFQVAHYLWEKYDPDFLMLHLYGNDQICHWLWHIFDETHPQYRKEESEKYFEKILEYYKAFDHEVGKLLKRAGEDVTCFMVSDHGFGPVYKAIDLNTWLYREGYLALQKRPLTKLRRLWWEAGLTPNRVSFMSQGWIAKGLGRLVRRLLKDQTRGGIDRVKPAHTLWQLLLSFNDIDWSRTQAFAPFGFGQIRINVQGRWAQGCVAPGAEYQRVKQEIVEKLRAVKDPESGERLDGEVMTKDEIYWGDFAEDAPDIFFVPVNGKYRPKSAGFTSNAVISHFFGMTGIHKMNGILIARGQSLQRGRRIEGAQILDIFPSVLYLMGMVIPEDVDGKVLHQMFTEEFLQQHPIRYSQESLGAGGQAPELPRPEEEEEVISRLRGLGYLE